VFQEDPQFELTGRTVQVKDEISTIESGFKIQPLRGAEFINLSDYSIGENVSILFSMVSKRICQQINTKICENANDTLNQAESAAYINFQGKKCMGTNRKCVCYIHRKYPLGTNLGQYSLLPNTPDDIKKSVNDGIGDIVSFLESASWSVLYFLQSYITFLDVKDKYRIPGMYAHNTWTRTRLREALPLNSMRVWIIGRAFTSTTTFTTLLYPVYPKIWMKIPSYFTSCFLPTYSLFQCVLEMLFVSILLFTIVALIPQKMESKFSVVMSLQKHATPK
jgi:hypothetical protein